MLAETIQIKRTGNIKFIAAYGICIAFVAVILSSLWKPDISSPTSLSESVIVPGNNSQLQQVDAFLHEQMAKLSRIYGSSIGKGHPDDPEIFFGYYSICAYT